MISRFVLSVLLSAAAPQTPAEQARHADELYSGGYFAEASAAYAAAYQAAADPDYLYSWAQSERRAGNCSRAVDLYREYVALDVSEEAKEAANKNARRCGGDLASPSGVQPISEPVSAAPQPTSSTTGSDAKPAAWRRDVPGITLLAGGAALGVAAMVLGVESAQHHRLAEDAMIEAQYATEIQRSSRTKVAAIICGSLAGAVLVGGAVRLAIVARRGANKEAATRWVPGRGLRF